MLTYSRVKRDMDLIYGAFLKVQTSIFKYVQDYLTTKELATISPKAWELIAKNRLYSRAWLLGGILFRALSILAILLAALTFTETPALAVSTGIAGLYFADHANHGIREYFSMHEDVVWLKVLFKEE